MAEKNLKVTIITRNDTAANWTTKNPVLRKGEMGIEIDTNKFKFGDGTKTWTELDYAVDITLDADHVFMTADVVATKAIGVWTPDSSGSVKIPYQDSDGNALSVQDWLQSLAGKAENPAIIQPSASITLTGAEPKEVGSEFTPSYTASLNAGSYQYGPATGVTASGYEISDGTTTKNSATGSFTKITVADNTNYKLTAKITHGAAPNAPKNNLGVEVANLKIAAGTKNATSKAVTGYRNVFYGSVTSKTGTPTSAVIRTLSKSGAAWNKGKNFNCPEDVGAMRVIIAVPATLSCTSIKDVNGLNAEAISGFTKTTVNVEGANGYTAIAYNVYYKDNASANSTKNNWNVTLG